MLRINLFLYYLELSDHDFGLVGVGTERGQQKRQGLRLTKSMQNLEPCKV